MKRSGKYLQCGIYLFRNKVNGKFYVGHTTSNFYNRYYTHISQFNSNSHHSKHFQKAWNKYGKDNFIFEIIEIIPKNNFEEMLEKEQYWIDFLQTWDRKYGYNICPKADGTRDRIVSEETKLKQSLYRKNLCNGGNWINPNPKGNIRDKEIIKRSAKGHEISIIQYSMNEEFIKEWESAMKVEEKLKILHTNIGNCLHNRAKSARGYIWKYKNNKDIV